ncbi:hypothetical protein QVZ41_14405 [Wenyingzhuangia sp. chi5]|uniref:Lipoprotein n=1 Tax=Wenyingzhuangia gilva TaxID=3057677 RepID=A0ABT8VVR0_9FLAO|nr:hypothetical protein [Wenyingzhuangia sp. chi5]MDO3696041.1 hypothetical protein [Wenyingzhuangia sp. chi5]
MNKILIFFAFLITLSCGQKNQKEITSINEKTEIINSENYINDSIKKKIFKIAYDNQSTAPSYIVFKVKNLINGETKEICCEAPFLSGAMHRELNIGYSKVEIKYIDSIILKNSLDFFEFKNPEALKNIDFNNYPKKKEIDSISKRYNIKKYCSNDSIKRFHFKNDTISSQKTFAHVMFNHGIIINRDCFAGNNISIYNSENKN